jgi:hypothetical protein
MNYIRQLIRAVRADRPSKDATQVRMLQGFRMGTDRMTNKQGER